MRSERQVGQPERQRRPPARLMDHDAVGVDLASSGLHLQSAVVADDDAFGAFVEDDGLAVDQPDLVVHRL